MDIALASVNIAPSSIENGNRARNVESARASRTDVRIARAIDEERHPADFQIESNVSKKIGASKSQYEARFGFDEVRVLVALTDVNRFDAAASHGVGDV